MYQAPNLLSRGSDEVGTGWLYCATHASMTVGRHSGTSCHGGVTNYKWGHNILLRTQFAMTTTIKPFKELCRYVLDFECEETSCYKATGCRKASL